MAEQQMANYTLTIEADSGYESTTEGRCTAEQYGQAMAALHGTIPAAQRQWVNATTWRGLTDEEIQTIWRSSEHMNNVEVCRAIEAKLKEKNCD
jgi:hypothetical protein